MAWFDQQWNNPSREDYFLMQIAQAVYQIPSLLFGERGEAERIKLKDMRLKFEEHFDKYKPPKPRMTKEQYSEMVKMRWFSLLGMTGVKPGG